MVDMAFTINCLTHSPPIVRLGLNVFYFDYQARTLDWRFDKRTQKLHNRKSRYMPVNMFGLTLSSYFDSQARTMDLRASRSTWISRSKSEAKDSGE
ncbi:hypothetical protein HID58_050973 [Brassica napus]|uniref:Uncharacterized protein n=1 Tax=Brassica napus TaxID=3708 RepID=A0ABQ8A7M5_BRANA|nr:hypothetical protein HID58_050973 [Brassica napus]